MNNPTLFDYMVGVTTLQAKTLCHKADPETSRVAAQKMVESGKLSEEQAMIFGWIKEYLKENNKTDFTPKELAFWRYSNQYYLIQKRMSILRRKGKIRKTDEVRDGQKVWRLL